MNPVGNQPTSWPASQPVDQTASRPAAPSFSPLTSSGVSVTGISAQEQDILLKIREQRERGKVMADFLNKLKDLSDTQELFSTVVNPLIQSCLAQAEQVAWLKATLLSCSSPAPVLWPPSPSSTGSQTARSSFPSPALSIASGIGNSPLQLICAEMQQQERLLEKASVIQEQMNAMLSAQARHSALVGYAMKLVVEQDCAFFRLWESYARAFSAPQNPANPTTQSVALPPPAAMPAIFLPPANEASASAPSSVLGPRMVSAMGFPDERPNPRQILHSITNHFDPPDNKESGNL